MKQEETPSLFTLSKNKNPHCTFRSVQTTRCHTEVDENGVPHRKCQRLLKKFKECPGMPTEVIEQVERDINPGSENEIKPFSPEHAFGDVPSDLETLFSRMDGMFGSFGDKVPSARDSKRSFRQKLGDYFAWEKDHEETSTTSRKKTHPEWKQFEKDFQEI